MSDTPNGSNLSPVLPVSLPTPIFYAGKPAVTFEMVEEFHDIPEGSARHAFHRHRDKLTLGEDFVAVPAAEFNQIMSEWVANSKCEPSSHLARPRGHARGKNRILLFETGYLLLSKPMTDDEAWRIMRALVRNYFKTPPPAPGAVANPNATPPAVQAELAAITAQLAEMRADLNRLLASGAVQAPGQSPIQPLVPAIDVALMQGT